MKPFQLLLAATFGGRLLSPLDTSRDTLLPTRGGYFTVPQWDISEAVTGEISRSCGSSCCEARRRCPEIAIKSRLTSNFTGTVARNMTIAPLAISRNIDYSIEKLAERASTANSFLRWRGKIYPSRQTGVRNCNRFDARAYIHTYVLINTRCDRTHYFSDRDYARLESRWGRKKNYAPAPL